MCIRDRDIEYFAGYQVNIKYDPELLEVLEPVPRPGEILNNEDYGSQAATAIRPRSTAR